MSNEIDYAHPNNKLKDVLFNVKLQDIYSEFRFPATLFNQQIFTNNHRAVVNQSNGEIISIVGKNYKLISNEKAIEMGKQIFTQLYPEIKTDDLIPYKVVAPISKASAHIDLIHKDVNFSVWEQETWLPFLRTTNSYNRSYALAFEIGFARKLCSNGVLFNKKTMKLKYLHSKSNRIELLNDTAQIKATSNLFIEQCKSLRKYDLPKQLMIPLVFQILNINLELPEVRQMTKKVNYLHNLIEVVKVLTDRYFTELGSNAYSAFNVMTELVSHQDEYKNLTGFYFNVRSFYTKPADWMDDFSNKISTNSVVIAEYLGKTIKSLERIKEQTQLEWMLN
jgi:hypothetical protein